MKLIGGSIVGVGAGILAGSKQKGRRQGAPINRISDARRTLGLAQQLARFYIFVIFLSSATAQAVDRSLMLVVIYPLRGDNLVSHIVSMLLRVK